MAYSPIADIIRIFYFIFYLKLSLAMRSWLCGPGVVGYGNLYFRICIFFSYLQGVERITSSFALCCFTPAGSRFGGYSAPCMVRRISETRDQLGQHIALFTI